MNNRRVNGGDVTILILEKLTRPCSVKLGVPSSMKARSVRYMPRYGTHGGLQLQTHIWQILGSKNTDEMCVLRTQSSIYFFSVSRRFLNLPSDDTVFWSRSMRDLVCKTYRFKYTGDEVHL